MHWHQIRKHDNGWLFPARNGGRVAVSFRGEDVRKVPFRGYFLRFEGAGEIPVKAFSPWERDPTDWFELWPLEPMLASSMEEAKQLFQPILAQIEDGSLDHFFEKKAYVPRIPPVLIKELKHPTHKAVARIVQRHSGEYLIGYAVYAPNGHYLPVSTPSLSTDLYFEWGQAAMRDEDGNSLETLADELASAEEIARFELDLLVAQDTEIQIRDPV